jgi:molybdopterin-guanine dinucleotide biosynthesis protein
MTRIIWITGRAATGKTTLVAEIEARLHRYRHPPAALPTQDSQSSSAKCGVFRLAQ